MRYLAIFLTAGALIGPAPATGQPTTTFTLDEAQRLALGRYEGIATAREQVAQAEQRRRQASASALPTVAVTAVTTRNLVTGAFEFDGQRIEVLPGLDYSFAITVTQPLYAGLRDRRVRDQAGLGIELAETMATMTTRDTLLHVTREYYQVLALQENVAISNRAVTVARESVRTAESRYRAGEEVETAVLRARVAESDARRQLLQGENGLTLARQRLALLLDVDEHIAVARPARPPRLGLPLAELVETGLRNRGVLQTVQMERQLAALEIDRRRGQLHPVVSAEGTYLRRRANFPSNQLSSVSVNATWTIFNGGRVAAEVRESRARLRELESREKLLREQTGQEIRTAYLNVDTLAASEDMLTAQVEFATRNAEATARAYRVGEATNLDLLESNTTLARSERELAMTAYNLDVAVYELHRAVGTLGGNLVAITSLGEDE